MTTASAQGSASELWRKASSILQKKVCKDAFQQYFQPIVPLTVTETELKLGVSSAFFAEWIAENFGDLLKDAVEEAAGKPFSFGLDTFEADKFLHIDFLVPDFPLVRFGVEHHPQTRVEIQIQTHQLPAPLLDEDLTLVRFFRRKAFDIQKFACLILVDCR